MKTWRQNENFQIVKEQHDALTGIARSAEPCRREAEAFRGTGLWSSRAGSCAWLAAKREAGGASRDRTGDLLLAKQALSQLSYGP